MDGVIPSDFLEHVEPCWRSCCQNPQTLVTSLEVDYDNNIADLFLILPVLVLTGTAVLAMSAVAVGRNYPVTAFITVAGLLLAALSAVTLMPGTNQQVTPLLIVDPYSLFFTAVICLSAMFIAVLSYPYLEGLDDDREEYFLLLGVATVGAVVLVSSNHFVSALLGLETLSMSLYGMVAYTVHSQKADKYPLEASVKYLVSLRCRIWISAVRYGAYLRANGHSGLCQSDRFIRVESRNGFSVVGLLLITPGSHLNCHWRLSTCGPRTFMRGLRYLPRPIWQQSARQQFSSCCYALWKFPER